VTGIIQPYEQLTGSQPTIPLHSSYYQSSSCWALSAPT
jgi:hypothetical protein